MNYHVHRTGTTLVELLLFIAILSLVVAIILPVLFMSTENRLLQQTVATVEENGGQMMQNIALRIRQAERVLSPARGATGAVLALQTGSGVTNPIIIGIQSGSLVIVRHSTQQIVSSSQIAVLDFVVRNTSASDTRQSVQVSFKVSRTIRLQQPHSYNRVFEGAFNLLPDDVVTGDSCGCSAPACVAGGTYQWEVCEAGACLLASTDLQCP